MINSGVILVSELPSELSKQLCNPTLTPPQGCGCVVNKLALFALLKMSPQLKELYPDMSQIDVFWYLIYMTSHTLPLKRLVHILWPYLPCNPSGKHTLFVGTSLDCLHKTVESCRLIM